MEPARRFFVADFSTHGELQLMADYDYERLEQIPGARDIIVHLATLLWRSPEGFETPLSAQEPRLDFRWAAVAPTGGIATLRCQGRLVSLSLLVSGKQEQTDTLILQAFQKHLLRELHDTGIEPAFGLTDARERPLVATIGFCPPESPVDRLLAALADRCFAAAYFRFQNLA